MTRFRPVFQGRKRATGWRNVPDMIQDRKPNEENPRIKIKIQVTRCPWGAPSVGHLPPALVMTSGPWEGVLR